MCKDEHLNCFFFFKIASVSCFPAVEFLEWDHPSKLLHMCMHMCVVCVHVKHTIPAQAALKVLEAHKWEFPSRKHFSGKRPWGMLIILSLPQLKWSAKHRMSLLYRTGFDMIAIHLFWHSAWCSPTTENWGLQAPGREGESLIFLQHYILDQASLSVATSCKPPQYLTLLPPKGKKCRGLDAYFVFFDILLKLILWKQKRLISVFETPTWNAW